MLDLQIYAWIGAACAVLLLATVLLCPTWLLQHDPIASAIIARTYAERNRRKPRRIILIRHAESQANKDKTIYARVPSHQIELTPHGHDQAREAGLELKRLLRDETIMFYVSPFVRSQQTFHHLAAPFSKDQYRMKTDPRLREQEWGNLQDPQAIDECMKHRNAYGRFYYRFPSGESGADVFDRVSTFLESLFRQMTSDHPVENIVIVAHGLQIRLFLMR